MSGWGGALGLLRALAGLALASSYALGLGCAPARPATQVIVSVEAEPGVRADAHTLIVRVFGGHREELTLPTALAHEVPFTVGADTWPRIVALAPQGRDPRRMYRVEASAYREASVDPSAPPTPLATVRAISGYVEGQTLRLQLVLQDACVGVRCDDPETTCGAGDCLDAEIDVDLLPVFRPDGGAGIDGGAPEDVTETDALAATDAYVDPDASRDPDAHLGVDARAAPDAYDEPDAAREPDASRGPDARVPGSDAGPDARAPSDAPSPGDTGTGTILPPRPIAPVSTGTVTSRRPTFRWALASGTDGARLELCADRGCTMVIESLDVTGSNARPTADLPPGVVFWRLFGRTAGASGTTASPTWQTEVGARSAAIDTSWGASLDVNGDGYRDLATGAPGPSTSSPGAAYVYLGGPSGIAAAPSTTLAAPAGGRFGWAVAAAGDVNGDGYGDLVVTAVAAAGYNGRAYVYLGGASGLAASPVATLDGSEAGSIDFGYGVAGAGDVDGDGYADIVTGAYDALSTHGRAYLFRGGPSGVSTPAARVYDSPDGAGSYFGFMAAGVGDLDGDGLGDFAVTAHAAAGDLGRVHVFLGRSGTLPDSPSVSITGSDVGGWLGYGPPCGGDLNGDGRSDLVVGAHSADSSSGRVHVFYGQPGGVATTPSVSLVGRDGTTTSFGIFVATGHADGDGIADLAVGAPGAASSTGRVHVYAGTTGMLAATPTFSFTGPDGAGASFGDATSIADVDADGFSELVVSARQWSSFTGRIYVFGGTVTGPSSTVARMLTSPAGIDSRFGRTIAM